MGRWVAGEPASWHTTRPPQDPATAWIRASSPGALLTNAELRRLGTSDNTAAGHRRLAAHYRAHAAEHTADAAIHDDIVNSARPRKTDDDAWDLARDAAHYAEHSREAAEALNELATLHEEIAKRSYPATYLPSYPATQLPSYPATQPPSYHSV